MRMLGDEGNSRRHTKEPPPEEIDYDDVEAATDKAIMLRIDKKTYWVPVSQLQGGLRAIPALHSGPGTVFLPHWLARDKGMI